MSNEYYDDNNLPEDYGYNPFEHKTAYANGAYAPAVGVAGPSLSAGAAGIAGGIGGAAGIRGITDYLTDRDIQRMATHAKYQRMMGDVPAKTPFKGGFNPIHQEYYPSGYERSALSRAEVEAARLRPTVVKNTPKSAGFAMRNAARDGLYAAYLAGPAYAPAMVGGAYAAAPIISGVRDYYDYQTMPRDEFYARKLGSMPKD